MGVSTSKTLLTIFTPAYNRAHLLPRLFESIAGQIAVGDPVEWLVIDDGSIDATPEVMSELALLRPDIVRLVKVPNGGKHAAFNRVASDGVGRWVLSIDSDDILAPGALKDVLDVISRVEADPNSEVGIIRGLSEFPEAPVLNRTFGVPSNPCFHYDWVNSSSTFDSTVVLRRDLLKALPFSAYDGETFQAEGFLWFRADAVCKTLFVGRVWASCFYQPDGLSSRTVALRANSPRGAMDVYREIALSKASRAQRFRAVVNYHRFRFHANDKRRLLGTGFDALGMIFGYALFLADKQRAL